MSKLSVSQKSQLVRVLKLSFVHRGWVEGHGVELDALAKHLLSSEHVTEIDIRNATLKVDDWVLVSVET